MATANVGYEQQYVLRDAGGNIVWKGSATVGVSYQVTSGEASSSISEGMAAIADTTDANLLIPSPQNAGTASAMTKTLSALRVASAASKGFLGVALELIVAGKTGLVGGPGTIAMVTCTSAAIAIGGTITGSATAGQCANLATDAIGVRLGTCIKANAQVGSTGTYAAGVLVSPL